MTDTLLTARNLSKTYSSGGLMQHVLRNVDLDLYSGDFTVIMGASGAGKSTLLYTLSGMDTPTLGEIGFQGEDLTTKSADQLALFRRAHCGFVFQQIHLIDSMTVEDNILAAGLLGTGRRREIADRMHTLLENVDLPSAIRTKFPAQLSGGEAQRVGIVRALINNPEILFADEPTGALNSQTGLDVLNTLTRFNRDGQSIAMVTHDVRSARRGNRILYLRDGTICGECDLGPYRAGDRLRHEKLMSFLSEMGW